MGRRDKECEKEQCQEHHSSSVLWSQREKKGEREGGAEYCTKKKEKERQICCQE